MKYLKQAERAQKDLLKHIKKLERKYKLDLANMSFLANYTINRIQLYRQDKGEKP